MVDLFEKYFQTVLHKFHTNILYIDDNAIVLNICSIHTDDAFVYEI